MLKQDEMTLAFHLALPLKSSGKAIFEQVYNCIAMQSKRITVLRCDHVSIGSRALKSL